MLVYLFTLLQSLWRAIWSLQGLRGSARQEALVSLQRPSRIHAIFCGYYTLPLDLNLQKVPTHRLWQTLQLGLSSGLLVMFSYIGGKSHKVVQRPSLWKPEIVHHQLKCIVGAALCVVASICASPVVALEGRFVGVTTLGTCTVKGRMIPASWSGSTVVFGTPGDYAAGSYVYKDGVGATVTSTVTPRNQGALGWLVSVSQPAAFDFRAQRHL